MTTSDTWMLRCFRESTSSLSSSESDFLFTNDEGQEGAYTIMYIHSVNTCTLNENDDIDTYLSSVFGLGRAVATS